ncbi:MAG: sigma-70 family RNA polymerase sigma factor [Pseudomonadota bacterium]
MFTEALEKIIPEIRGYARMLCGDRERADDIVQNACLKAWDARRRFDPNKGSFKAWMFTITRNEFLQAVRQQTRTHARDQGDQSVFAAGLSEDCQMLNRAACSEAIQHLFTLKPEQRDVFILVVVAGYSYEEAAKICKCSIGTIKSRINRARARLETLYDDASEASARGGRPRSFHAVADLLLYADRLVQRAA